MELYLKNIGKIAEANVEIKGITVIAGENDTGKSTVGKALFSIFNSFFEIEKQIRLERKISVVGIFQKLALLGVNLMTPAQIQERVDAINELTDFIINGAGGFIQKPDMLKEKMSEIFDMQIKQTNKEIKESDIEDAVVRIIEVLKISDADILCSVINKKINAEFNSQVVNIYSDTEGKIILNVRDRKFVVKIFENIVSVDNAGYGLHTEAIYIDDPLVLDELAYKEAKREHSYSNHRTQLKKKLFMEHNNTSVVEEIIIQNKFKNIQEKLMTVCEGDIVRLKNKDIGYQLNHSDKALSIKNLSTGLKTFAILKTLLTNGALETNGTVILDEPEIHLHPEWQLLFAEIIVLLHKEFGMHILLNTHSPYFLRAIEVYSAKYEVSDRCRYYLSEAEKSGGAYIHDVTNEINKIYEKLSLPLQKMEDERWNY